MAQEVVGSTPTTHPILLFPCTMGCRQAVRHQTLTLALVGSNPATPAIFYDPLAQLVEHLTFNQVVRSSTLRRITKLFFYCRCFPVCGCGGIGRRARFRFWCPKGVWVQVPSPAPNLRFIAGVAHLVERSLAKAEVAGSSPVSRSIFYGDRYAAIKNKHDSKGIEAA